MNHLNEIIIGCSYIVCICIFVYRFKYAARYGVLLLGLFLFLDVIFVGLAALTHHFLFPNLPEKSSLFLFNNILLIFQFGIFLLLYSKYKTIKSQLPIALFSIFLVIWFIEFSIKGGQEVVILNFTTIFLKADLTVTRFKKV